MSNDAAVTNSSGADGQAKRVTFQVQKVLSDSDRLPPSTRWHRKHGRPSRRDKAVKQQLLTPCEEQALIDHVLRWSRNGYPIPTKSLPYLAAVILRRRVSSSKSSTTCDTCKPPSKKWRLAFYKRHPNVKSRRLKAKDWKRHDFQIYDKMVDWFQVIGRELQIPDVLQENVYNMDESGILLSAPTSMEVLVGRDDLRIYRGTGVQRQLITAIECISADGRSLAPLIIWPAATQRSTWTTHPTPDSHFACSETGYTNSAISLEWMLKVFDASTRSRANGRPRLVISDGFGTHKSLEVLAFCYENNIILCRLPSHTSYKLQPCDVGVFGPLKAAYREQVDRLFRSGANVVGKQHFTLLYDRARQIAITKRNISSGWSKAGLFPFNPERVLRDIPKPQQNNNDMLSPANYRSMNSQLHSPLKTPTTAKSLENILSNAESRFAKANDGDTQVYFRKVAKAAQKAFADRALA